MIPSTSTPTTMPSPADSQKRKSEARANSVVGRKVVCGYLRRWSSPHPARRSAPAARRAARRHGRGWAPRRGPRCDPAGVAADFIGGGFLAFVRCARVGPPPRRGTETDGGGRRVVGSRAFYHEPR